MTGDIAPQMPPCGVAQTGDVRAVGEGAQSPPGQFLQGAATFISLNGSKQFGWSRPRDLGAVPERYRKNSV